MGIPDTLQELIDLQAENERLRTKVVELEATIAKLAASLDDLLDWLLYG